MSVEKNYSRGGCSSLKSISQNTVRAYWMEWTYYWWEALQAKPVKINMQPLCDELMINFYL